MDDGTPTDSADAIAASAVFNPCGTVGIVVREAVPPVPAAQGGDLALPLLAALVGGACIAALVRRVLD